ncbi:MAG TPA: hypothetical protein VJB11_02070 [archaeon]|nr:hypothetical protein [archaeon]
MGIVDFILRRDTVYSLRKKYDRIRERADRERDRQKKMQTFRILDQIEPTIIAMEEHNMTMVEKQRMKKYIKSSMEEAKLMLKKDYVPQQQKQVQYRR